MADDQETRQVGNESETDVCPQDSTETMEKSAFLGFTGSFTHGIDAKGRVVIPASFRDALGDKFAVCPTPDYKAVALYPIDGWMARKNELEALVHKDARAQQFMDMFSKYSYTECEADQQGRLLMPGKIRSWRLGDARDVDLNGAMDHVRILTSEKSREADESFDDMYPDPLAVLSAIQRGKDE